MKKGRIPTGFPLAFFVFFLFLMGFVYQSRQTRGQALTVEASLIPAADVVSDVFTSSQVEVVQTAAEAPTIHRWELNGLVTRAQTARSDAERREIAQAMGETARAAHKEGDHENLVCDAYTAARQGFRAVGDRASEAAILLDLAETQRGSGRFADAEKSLRDAFTLHESGLGDNAAEAVVLDRLSDLLRTEGHDKEAQRLANLASKRRGFKIGD